MATDATGTPTAKGIPTYDTSNDAPSGLGFNAAMAAIDAILDKTPYVAAGTPTEGQSVVYSGGAWGYTTPIGLAMIIALGG